MFDVNIYVKTLRIMRKFILIIALIGLFGCEKTEGPYYMPKEEKEDLTNVVVLQWKSSGLGSSSFWINFNSETQGKYQRIETLENEKKSNSSSDENEIKLNIDHNFYYDMTLNALGDADVSLIMIFNGDTIANEYKAGFYRSEIIVIE